MEIQDVVKLTIAVLGSNAAAAAVGYWIKRREARTRAPADMLGSIAEFSDSLSQGGKEVMNWLRSELKFLRDEVTRAREEATLARVAHEDCEHRLDAKMVEINKLMNGRVAPWGERAPDAEEGHV